MIPTHLDHLVFLEYWAFYKAVDAKGFALAVSTPQPFVVEATERYLRYFCETFNHKSLGIVLNFYGGERMQMRERTFVIPFIKELFFKGVSPEVPKEFKELADKIFNMLREVG